MDELISRQAAIDLLKQMRKDGDMVPWEGKNVFARIRKLPTIQPELGTNLAEVGTDCISRQKAIEIVEKYFEKIGLNGDICVDGLKQLPSIQPERKECEEREQGKCPWYAG